MKLNYKEKYYSLVYQLYDDLKQTDFLIKKTNKELMFELLKDEVNIDKSRELLNMFDLLTTKQAYISSFISENVYDKGAIK